MAKIITVRLILSLAFVLKLKQLDINSSFLHVDLKKKIYTINAYDYSLLTKSFDDSFTTILVYIDDIILARNNDQKIIYIKQAFDNSFRIKDLEELCFSLVLKWHGQRKKS